MCVIFVISNTRLIFLDLLPQKLTGSKFRFKLEIDITNLKNIGWTQHKNKIVHHQQIPSYH